MTAYDLIDTKTEEWEFMNPSPTPLQTPLMKNSRSQSREEPVLKLKLHLLKSNETTPVNIDVDKMDYEVPFETLQALPKLILTSKSNQNHNQNQTPSHSHSQSHFKTPSTTETTPNRLVNAIGIISNGAILRHVLPTDIKSHTLHTTNPQIRTLNFRVLLSGRAVGVCQVVVLFDGVRLVSSDRGGNTNNSNANGNGSVSGGVSEGESKDIASRPQQDYNASLNLGVNAFEVFVNGGFDVDGTTHHEFESYSVFINRL